MNFKWVNVNNKGFVYSITDYQLAIETSKEFEYLLNQEFDARAQGCSKRFRRSSPTIRSICYVATLRNKLIHHREMRALPDRPLVLSMLDSAMAELNFMIEHERRNSQTIHAVECAMS